MYTDIENYQKQTESSSLKFTEVSIANNANLVIVQETQPLEINLFLRISIICVYFIRIIMVDLIKITLIWVEI